MTGKIALLILLFAAWIAVAKAGEKHHERWYQDKYCSGVKEYVLEDRARVDCLLPTFAIEYDFGHKWAECAGQAQYYARSTNRLAGCVLINAKERYLKRLLRAFDGAIWVADDEQIKRVR